MGIQSPNSFLWRTKDIDWKVQHNNTANRASTAGDTYPVVELLKKLHSLRLASGAIDRGNPGVAFDANAIGFNNKARAILAIGEAAQAFVQKGIDVTIVFDGTHRHQSKRDAIKRRASRAKDQVELVELRSQLLAIGVGIDSTDEDQAFAEEIAIKIRRLETKAAAQLPPDFSAKVKTALEGISTQFTGKLNYIDAPHQADPSLAKLALRMEVDAIVTTDSDFAMCVGPGADGKSDVMLNIEVVGKTIRSCQLSTGQSTCKAFIEGFFHPWANLPKHPFFDGVVEARVRALFALAVGCDANPGGAHGFGAAKVSQLIQPEDCFADTNVFDKGFRCTIAAKNAGNQKVLQPTFAKSDEQFTRSETLHSAAVAVVRSGNERAVNRVKCSWFIRRGRSLQTWDVGLVDDVLLVWSFQVNFMCDKFL